MKETTACKPSLSGGKVLLALTALLVLIGGQLLAQLAAQALSMAGVPAWVCNVVGGAAYGVLVFGGLVLLCRKGLGLTPADCRLLPVRLTPFWAAAALLMPAVATGGLLLLPGHWQAGTLPPAEKAAVLSAALCFTGLGVGFVEEAVFRGVLLTALERRWNRAVAVLVPSVAFALLHCVGAQLGLLDLLQLLVAGTLVGVVFSLVTLETGSIWCSALMHAVWNIVMIGGLIAIGTEAAPRAFVSYVLDTGSFLLTGGEFGIEASLAAIAAYTLFLALALLRRKTRRP